MPNSNIVVISTGELEILLDNSNIPFLARDVIRTGVERLQKQGSMPLREVKKILEAFLAKLSAMKELPDPETLAEITERVAQLEEDIEVLDFDLDNINTENYPKAVNESFVVSLLRMLAERRLISTEFLIAKLEELSFEARSLILDLITRFQGV